MQKKNIVFKKSSKKFHLIKGGAWFDYGRTENPKKSKKVLLYKKKIVHLSFTKKMLTYLIFSIMYLSGIRPSWPLTDPFHQSFDTCLNKTKVSPLWKLTSRADLALKSYKAWASIASDSVKEKMSKSQSEVYKFENSFQVGFTTPIIGYRSRSCVFLTKNNFSRISVPF